MEFLELLFAGGEACGCFVEVLALCFDVGAGVRGYKLNKENKERRQAAKEGEKVPHKSAVWPFLLLLLGAVFFTGLVLFKWTRRLG